MEHTAFARCCEEADVGHLTSPSMDRFGPTCIKTVIHSSTLPEYIFFLQGLQMYNWMLRYTCMCITMLS